MSINREYYIAHFCMQVISWNYMSVGQYSVSNMKPIQFNHILPTTVVGIFPLFNAWLNIVCLLALFSYPLCNLEFLALLLVRSFLAYLLLVLLLICFIIFFNSYMYRDFIFLYYIVYICFCVILKKLKAS